MRVLIRIKLENQGKVTNNILGSQGKGLSIYYGSQGETSAKR